MTNFRQFLESSEEEKNMRETIKRLPSKHRKLIDGYKFTLHQGNTLDGDDQHVGFLDDGKKTIGLAAPWLFGREFTFLHEVAHKVWKELVSAADKKDWKKLSDKDPEEDFCMAYAQYYTKNKLKRYDNPEWMTFIQRLK